MDFPIRWLLLLINVVLFGGTFVLYCHGWLSYRHGQKRLDTKRDTSAAYKEAQDKGA